MTFIFISGGAPETPLFSTTLCWETDSQEVTLTHVTSAVSVMI